MKIYTTYECENLDDMENTFLKQRNWNDIKSQNLAPGKKKKEWKWHMLRVPADDRIQECLLVWIAEHMKLNTEGDERERIMTDKKIAGL